MKTRFMSFILLSLQFFVARAFGQGTPYMNGVQADISLLNINSGDLLDRGSSFVGSSFYQRDRQRL